MTTLRYILLPVGHSMRDMDIRMQVMLVRDDGAVAGYMHSEDDAIALGIKKHGD